MPTTTITIPATIDEAVAELNGIGSLLTAKRWERAAIVAAFVEPSKIKGRHPNSRMMGTEKFAELGINGLTTADTVSLYANRWLDAHDGKHPKPGAKVRLPNDSWEKTRTGTNGHNSPAGAVETVNEIMETHGPDVVAAQVAAAAPESIAKTVREPEVAKAVVDDHDAHRAVIHEESERHSGVLDRERSHSDITDVLTQLLQRLGAIAFVEAAKELRESLTARHHADLPWKPGELEAVQKKIEEALSIGRDCQALLTPVSDEELAKLLDG